MSRPIDHLVLAVPDLAAAMSLYGAMGFTVGGENRHPWGTVNAVVQLGGATFLELIGLGAGFAIPPDTAAAAPFARAVAAAVGRGGGLAMVALGSADADDDAEAFRSFGFGPGRRLDFGRSAEAPDGTRRAVRFSLAFVEGLAIGDAGLFTCRHRDPDDFWRPDAQRHANGATRLDSVVLAVAEPERHAGDFEMLFGTPALGPAARPSFATAGGRMDLLAPSDAASRYGADTPPGRFAGFGVAVESLGPVRSCLRRSGVDHAEVAGTVVVPATAAFGVALAFAPAPCHSVARSGETAA